MERLKLQSVNQLKAIKVIIIVIKVIIIEMSSLGLRPRDNMSTSGQHI